LDHLTTAFKPASVDLNTANILLQTMVPAALNRIMTDLTLSVQQYDVILGRKKKMKKAFK
jgi:hypothetical protein